MQNVMIKGMKCSNKERALKLNNGSLVVYFDRDNSVIGTFLVTSFRNSKQSNPVRWDNTATYCSLVNLDNGKIEFEEPCSRSTTEQRVLNHLNQGSPYQMNGQYVKVFKNGNFRLEVELGEEML